MAASRKIVSEDSKKMSPILWGTLPKELLVCVLARLPLPDITQLCNLSKEWNRKMVTVNSEINRALDKFSLIMVTSLSGEWNSCNIETRVIIRDLGTHKLQISYTLHLRGPNFNYTNPWNNMGARDGGLVCFVSTHRPKKSNPLCIVVVNLLTQVQRTLPPLQYVYYTPPKMMCIEVDSATKYYRVVVVGKKWKGHRTVEIYDSGARQWTKATPPLGSIFGGTYKWKYYNYCKFFDIVSKTQSVYDFAERQLKRFDEKGPFQGLPVNNSTFQRDCVFVLHRITSNSEILQAEGYCITKYRIQNNAKDWVQERSYLCSPFKAFSESDYQWMTLKACEGYLTVSISGFSSQDNNFWLLNLSTGEWSGFSKCFYHYPHVPWMDWASWNVVP